MNGHRVPTHLSLGIIFVCLTLAYQNSCMEDGSRVKSIASTSATDSNAIICDRILDRTLLITDFGATKNDGSDDQPAIQKAFNCAVSKYKSNAQGRASVYIEIPEGVFNMSRSVIFDNSGHESPRFGGSIILRGNGKNKSIIKSASTNGLFKFKIKNNKPSVRSILHIEKFTIMATVKNTGAAIKIDPVIVSKNAIRLRLHIKDINIHKVSGSSDAYFKYGLKVSGLKNPHVNKMSVKLGAPNLDGSTCFHFGMSYGIVVKHSYCSGSQFGLLIPYAAEGDIVSSSTFENVETGVYIRVVPGSVPGPSSMDGKIVGNTFKFKKTGVSIDSKSWMTITKNKFEYLPGFTGKSKCLILRDAHRITVTKNKFNGDGATTIGVSIIKSGKKLVKDASKLTVVTQNSFKAVKHGVFIGPTVKMSYIFDNEISAVKELIIDKGVKSYFAEN